jgi:hypothetical protein
MIAFLYINVYGQHILNWQEKEWVVIANKETIERDLCEVHICIFMFLWLNGWFLMYVMMLRTQNWSGETNICITVPLKFSGRKGIQYGCCTWWRICCPCSRLNLASDPAGSILKYTCYELPLICQQKKKLNIHVLYRG